jgi:hypothetical protein
MLKVSAFHIDKQKSFVPKKVSATWLTPMVLTKLKLF